VLVILDTNNYTNRRATCDHRCDSFADTVRAVPRERVRLTPRGVHSTPYPDILQFLDSRSQSIVNSLQSSG